MAIRLLRSILASTLMLSLLVGCWDADSIEKLDYAKALGIDLVDGQYVVYLQLPNLSSAAKKDGPIPEVPIKSWIGIGKGDSVNEAIGQIFRSAPKKIVWGHTTAMIFSDRMLQSKDFYSVLEDLNRFREFRYTMWIYGTKASFSDLFSVSPTFEASRLFTIMQNPIDNYDRYSYVLPIRLHDYMFGFQNKGAWAIIPSLAINSDNWQAGKKPHMMHVIDGVYTLHMETYSGYFPLDTVQGMRWLEPHTRSSSLKLTEGDKTLAVLTIQNPKSAIEIRQEEGNEKIDVKIKLNATLTELHSDLTAKQLIEKAQKLTEEQIRSTYLAGLKSKSDLLQLSQHLYIKNPKRYNELTNNGEKLFLQPDSLGKIDVDLDIQYLGKYKFVK